MIKYTVDLILNDFSVWEPVLTIKGEYLEGI